MSNLSAYRILLSSVIVILAVYVSLIRYTGAEMDEAYRKAHQIKLGMTKAEVLKAVGPPTWIAAPTTVGDRYEWWRFGKTAGSSYDVSCTFETCASRVVAIERLDEGQWSFNLEFLTSVGFDSLDSIHRSLLSISIGWTSDSVYSLLGSPLASSADSTRIIWRYPREWLGFADPRVTFDRATGRVIYCDLGGNLIASH